MVTGLSPNIPGLSPNTVNALLRLFQNLQTPAVSGLTNNYQTANYQLVSGDIGTNTCVVMNMSTPGTLTVPTVATLGHEPNDGDVVYLHTINTGIITVVPAGGVTLTAPFSKVQLATKGARAMLVYMKTVGTNQWSLEGNLGG